MLASQPRVQAERQRAVLTRAAMKAAEILDLPQNQLAATLGVSAATVSRMKSGAYLLDPARKEWELAVLWVRAFRSLDAITGGRDEASRAWLHSANRDLRARPVDLLSSLTGVVHLVEYLDEARARI